MTAQRWDVAWQAALYGPQGFYRGAAPAEHFATSAQGLGGAGDLLAQALLTLADRHELHRIVEVAAGRGELLTALARAPRPGLGGVHLAGVDVVERPADLAEAIDWILSPGGSALPSELDGLTDTLLLAHEWLDVVPCPVATREAEGTWRHVLVATDGTEHRGEPVSGPELDWLRAHVPDHVGRAEIGLSRDSAYQDLVQRVETGLVVAVDYGHTRANRPGEGSLTGYRSGTQINPVPDGSCDLTAHVAVDSLGAARLTTQRDVVHDLLGRAEIPAHALASADPAAYLAQLSRANAVATLTRPGGLGDFWWAMTPRGAVSLG